MKKFILNGLLFLAFVPLVIYIKPLSLLYKERYKNIVAGREIYLSIQKSKKSNKSKIILLGDSVANQLFSNKTNSETINSLACNQAVGMVGQYILLNNYINKGNKLDTVYIIYTAFSFQNNLDQVYTYHYFLKPFFIEEYKTLFTETVKKQIDKIPYNYICREPYILTSNWAPDFISKDKINYTFLSPISLEYLVKIKELSIKNHFKLVILPPPTSLKNKSIIEKMNKNEIIKNNLSSEFKNYFNNIIYLDDSCFVDGTHLKETKYYTEYYKNKFIK